MSAGLQITLSVNRGTPRTVELGASALVGSSRAADVRLPDPALAALHLRLVRDGELVTAIALAAGVLLDGEELPVDEPREVSGRTLDVGPLRLVPAPRDVTVDETDVRGRTESLAREIVRDLMGGEAGDPALAPELVVENGPAAGQRLTLLREGERVVIGRGDHAGWVLLDADLSRSHAAVVRDPDGTRVYDMGSKNGTRVGATPVAVGPPGVLLADGVVIGLGDTLVRFIDPAAGMLADLEGRMAAIGGGAQAATTQTRPGHSRAAVALEAPPVRPPPATGSRARPPRFPIAAVLAAVVALLALALLAALVFSG